MSAFSVQWRAVETFAEGIEVLDQASSTASAYTHHVSYEVGAGDIMGRLGQITTGNPQEVAAAFSYLQLISQASAAELVKVAKYYRKTDEDVAAAFDKSY